ncbi:MAG: TRAP transporter large permease subunit, partial [Desulfofundulus sp.]
IGLLTPPVGTALYVACNIAKVSLVDISKAVLRFIAVILVVLFLVTYVPGITMWVPHLFK